MLNTQTMPAAESLEALISDRLSQEDIIAVYLEFFPQGTPRTAPTVQHHAVLTIEREHATPMIVHLECRPIDEGGYLSRTLGRQQEPSIDEYWIPTTSLLDTWRFVVSLCDQLAVTDVGCRFLVSATTQSRIQREWLDRQVRQCRETIPAADSLSLTLIERLPERLCLMMECFTEQEVVVARIMMDIDTSTQCDERSPRTSYQRVQDQVPVTFLRCHSFEEAWQLASLVADALTIPFLTLEQMPS